MSKFKPDSLLFVNGHEHKYGQAKVQIGALITVVAAGLIISGLNSMSKSATMFVPDKSGEINDVYVTVDKEARK